MQDIDMDYELIILALKELEYCPVHYVHHFADAFAVLAYHHPDDQVKKLAYDTHYYIAEELFHFMPETKGMFLKRHEDKL
jgi:hypothetical protein